MVKSNETNLVVDAPAKTRSEDRMVDILFATNRMRDVDTPQGVPNFNDLLLPAGQLWCGTASVDGINMHDPDAGTITKIPDLVNQAGFSPTQMAALTASTNPILVFIHGTDNDFEDAIQRAAYNKAWLKAVAGQSFDVVAFTWPARAYGSLADVFQYPADYKADQQQANASAAYIGLFFHQLYQLQLGTRKLCLLCHSMGNRALGAAVEAWYASGGAPVKPLFDVAILAAADETKDTLSEPGGGRLTKLRQLASGVTVYFSEADILMAASDALNDYVPLGLGGPTAPGALSTDVVDLVDCTDVNDYVAPRLSLDLSHQYYRQSPIVRADIAAKLLNTATHRYHQDPDTHIWQMTWPPLPYPVVS
jgi:esterase/lipase superfamily enzyme